MTATCRQTGRESWDRRGGARAGRPGGQLRQAGGWGTRSPSHWPRPPLLSQLICTTDGRHGDGEETPREDGPVTCGSRWHGPLVLVPVPTGASQEDSPCRDMAPDSGRLVRGAERGSLSRPTPDGRVPRQQGASPPHCTCKLN